MPARSLRGRVVAALERRAQTLLGPDASPIEYAERWVEAGLSLTALTRAIALDLGYPISRGFMSFTCQRLTPDARRRIKAARHRGRGLAMPASVAELRPVGLASRPPALTSVATTTGPPVDA